MQCILRINMIFITRVHCPLIWLSNLNWYRRTRIEYSFKFAQICKASLKSLLLSSLNHSRSLNILVLNATGPVIVVYYTPMMCSWEFTIGLNGDRTQSIIIISSPDLCRSGNILASDWLTDIWRHHKVSPAKILGQDL